jgi:penicillin-binding protein 1A
MRNFIKDWLTNEAHPRHQAVVVWMWRLLLGGLLAVFLLFLGLSFTDLPSVAELENPETNEASLVYAVDGSVLGKYYADNRVPVRFEDLPEDLVQALIATEDERYYQHTGIDFKGVVRAVAFLGQRGGASTITQQLAKDLFTKVASKNIVERIVQKLKEWIIAVRLERKYTKEEIIALYLNRYDFINQAQGIRSAAEVYFGKPLESLNTQEGAMLVGMLKNASLYDPLRRSELVTKRREVVLNQMVKLGFLDEAVYDSLRQTPLGINYTRQTHIDGLAPYFRMILAEEVKDLLQRPEYRQADGSTYDIYRDGLRIYTTIDPRIQAIAEEEAVKHMASLQETFFQHWQRLDPWTYKRGSETEIPVEIRQANLTDDIRASSRYQRLREQYLGDLTRNLEEATGLVFHEDDREVERLVREKQEGGVIADLVARNFLSASLADGYRKVLRHEQFPRLQAQWKLLQEAVEAEFNQETEMTVFAYNEKMQTDTVMTPLDSVRYHRMILQIGSMSVEPQTGYVRSWVGGVNHRWFQYDHVNRHTRRQVGSTFKPFVYATTIDLRGISPCQQYPDVRVTIQPGDGQFYLNEPWSPRNSDGEYTGAMLTLKDGLAKSKNTISVTLMKELGSPDPVREVVSLMGVDKDIIPRSPSICLGSVDLSVTEMTGAYSTFVNNGIYVEPTYLLRIEDRYGRTIFEHVTNERQVLKPSANYAMLDMLQYASGFMGQVRGPVGGKTGTTNDHSDGWFMGLTPNLVVGTWVGGDDRWVSFRTLAFGQGAYMAKPYFRNFVTRLQNDTTLNWDFTKTFYRPPGDLGIELDCDAYLNMSPGSEQEGDPFDEDPFQIDNEPDFGG